jgi:hypothetical protein
MARRHGKHHKKTSRRRRRMGAMPGKADLMQTALAIAGGVGARLLVTKLPDTIANVDISKYKPYAPLVVGLVAPMLIKNPMIKPLATGMLVVGGVGALQSMDIIAGMGFNDAPMVANIPPKYLRPAQVAGQTVAGNFVAGKQSKYCG